MAKAKRVSINALEKAIENAAYKNECTAEWNGVPFVITKRLSLVEMMKFVDNVSKLCLSEDGVYLPEVMNYAIGCNILERYANFTLPSNIEKRYDFIVACADLIESIVAVVDESQFKSIMRGINDKVDYMAQSNVEKITKNIEDLFRSLEEMEKKLEPIFGDLDSDTVKAVMRSVSENGIDEGKLMKAYLESRNTAGTVKEAD